MANGLARKPRLRRRPTSIPVPGKAPGACTNDSYLKQLASHRSPPSPSVSDGSSDRLSACIASHDGWRIFVVPGSSAASTPGRMGGNRARSGHNFCGLRSLGRMHPPHHKQETRRCRESSSRCPELCRYCADTMGERRGNYLHRRGCKPSDGAPHATVAMSKPPRREPNEPCPSVYPGSGRHRPPPRRQSGSALAKPTRFRVGCNEELGRCRKCHSHSRH
jgi:hypothetical protein